MENEQEKIKKKGLSTIEKIVAIISGSIALGMVIGEVTRPIYKHFNDPIVKAQQEATITRALTEGTARKEFVDSDDSVDYIIGNTIYLKRPSKSYEEEDLQDYTGKIKENINGLDGKINDLSIEIIGLETKKDSLQNKLYELEK